MKNSSLFHWLTILISGALYPLGMAPFNFWPAVIIGLTVLFSSLKTTHSAKQNFTKSLVFGFGIFISGASWIYVSIHEYGFLPAPIAAFATVLFCLFISTLFASTFRRYFRNFIHWRKHYYRTIYFPNIVKRL